MKLEGFLVAPDQIGIEANGVNYDLHNNFDFDGLSYNVSGRSITLAWKRNSGEWVQEGMPSHLFLEFEGVSLFKAKQRDPELPFSEDDCVRTIGFMWNDMTEEMEGSVSHESSKESSHFLIDFMSDLAIKISAEKAYARFEQK